MKNVIKNFSNTFKTFLALSLLSAGVGTYGDDTEVFYSVNVSKPNLLFVLDISGSMNSKLSGSAEVTTITKAIEHRNADSTQLFSDKKITRNTETSIELSEDVMARFRFKDLGIPRDTNISSAYIQFQAGVQADTGAAAAEAKFAIYTEQSDDAQLNTDGIKAKKYGTVEWEPGAWVEGDMGPEQRTPDLKDIVQQVIDRDGKNKGWYSNNGLAIYIYDKEGKPGKRWVSSFDNPNYAPPVLIIEIAGSDKRKIEVMKESLRVVLEDAPDNVKVGLMNYGQEGESNYKTEDKRHHNVSGVAFPLTDINAKAREVIPTAADLYNLPNYPDENKTVREYVADIADSWNQSSFTPIVDSLYEAALYYRGEKIHYGQTLPIKNGAHPSTYDGPVVTTDVEIVGRDRANAPKYITPIESSCQENYIVLMTDGAPTYSISGNGKSIEDSKGPLARRDSITTGGPQGPLASAIGSCSSPAGVDDAGTCGAELTHYLATHDNLPDPTGSFPNGQEGDQYIKTFTIGFGTGAGSDTEEYLQSLATYDDGNAATKDDGYFEASTPEALSEAFREILTEVAAPKGTLASPGYSVNVKNGLEHEKDIYIPVFDRKNSARWSGNLKKFEIVDINGRRQIQGKNNLSATDELGNFTSNALDIWSNSPDTDPDGKAVQKGGLANKLVNPDARKIYSNLTGDTNVVLSNMSNALKIDNIANISNSDLGLASTSTLDYRKTIVNFMRGWKNGDATSGTKAARLYMGDMLHSEPMVITYKTGSNKQQVIFAGTNEGYLHAFDTTTGEEKFAFIPAELLAKLPEHLYLNSGTQADHKYGVDGVITADVERAENGDAEKVILYFGLRRGGNAFYALDVTSLDNPKLLWRKGKSSDTSSPYNNMGQSWSTPYVAKVGVDGTATPAVLVSGGYDEDEDRDLSDGSSKLDSALIGNDIDAAYADEGNNIYIFAAGNGSNAGQLLWSMDETMRSQITHSIPGGLRPLDTNYNGLIDRIYFADTGGNVWRLDLSEDIGGSGTSRLKKLAALGGSDENNRMFFNEPDVTTLKLNGKNVFGVAIGSGFRPHPMDKSINDKFFFLVDESPHKPLDDEFQAIVITDLAKITVTNGSVNQTGSITDTGIDKKHGWVIDLPESGEKVLGTSIAFDGNIAFTTLVPEVLASGSGIDQCSAPVTQSRFYAFNVLSGEPGLDLDMDGDIDDNDAYITTGTEILGKPQIVFNPPVITDVVDEGGNATGEKSCTHPVDIRTGKKLSQTSGYEACRLESVYWSDPVLEQ